MARNDVALKRRILIDGNELPGLVECSPVKDEEGQIEVPGYDRKYLIKDGVKLFDALETVHKIAKEQITQKFLYKWFSQNEFHDVTIIETDATGQEVNRWLLRDCQDKLYDEREFNAAGVTWFGVRSSILCPSEPINQIQ